MTGAAGTTTKKPEKRREWGEGSVYQRKSDWRWIGAVEVKGKDADRPRATVSNKGCVGGCPPRCSHRTQLLKKLRKKQQDIEANGTPTQHASTTVKQWAATWLEIKKEKLSPNGYNAAASPIRKWIVPTIGHKRLDALTPADLRAVAKAQRAAGRKGATAAATHRTLLNMLRSAIVEGHQVPHRVLLVPAPTADKSDRMDLPVDQSVACLRVAADLPHGVRWALALLYGPRQGEVLGLVDDCMTFEQHVDPENGDTYETGEIRLEWQLDALPYEHGCDGGDPAPTCGKRAASCPKRGFRVPDGHESRRLVDAWHLVRPKSKKGIRVLPMTRAFAAAMRGWLAARPANPWGLVFPAADGTPANDKGDLEEWHAIQGAASLATYDAHTDLGPVLVGHPTRAATMLAGGKKEPHGYFHIHECRNVTATQLGEAGVDPVVIQSLLGHATAAQSGEYRRVHRGPKLAAIEAVAEVLPFNPRR